MEVLLTRVAVIMQRIALDNRWQPYAWRPLEVVNEALLPEISQRPGPLCLRQDEADTRWLFAGFEIRLFRDEGEGYYLNLSSPVPCWFVMWRLEEVDGGQVAVPKRVTLSYNEAARLMDGGERVDTLPLEPELAQAMAAFTEDHYRQEPKKKRKRPSFEGGEGVERMAKAEGGQGGR
jgi:hypothetical protein